MLKLRIIFLITAACVKVSVAQTNLVFAELDTNKIKIGEQINLLLRATINANDKITWPLLAADSLTDKIELVNKGKIDTTFSADKKQYILQQKLIITAFDSGYWVLPPFHFSVNGDTTNILKTEPILIEVNTLAVDTAKVVRDIKKPLDAPLTFREILPYLVYGIIGIALVTALVYYFKKRNKKEFIPAEIKHPEIPAHIWALTELNLLNNEKLWQQGKYKMYHIRLADILRVYLEKKYAIYAMEQTTDEILTTMRSIDITSEQRAKLRQILFLSDMVKFAKENPLASENELSYQNIMQFIHETSTITQTKNDQLV